MKPRNGRELDYMKLPKIVIDKRALKIKALKVGVVATLALGATVGASLYFEAYEWNYQSPIIIKLQAPLVITERTHELLSPVPKVQAQAPEPVESIDLERVLDGIHTLESSKGTAKQGLHVYCNRRGLSNEYGYGGMALMQCFDSKEQARDAVRSWLRDNIASTGSLGAAMCKYNTGTASSSCPYYINYQNLQGE